MTTTQVRTSVVRGAGPGLAVALVLMLAALTLPQLLDWNVHVRSFPPLHAYFDPRVGPGTLPAALLAVLASLRAIDLAERLSWRRLLLSVYAAGLAWLLALAFVDGPGGVGDLLNTPYEYLGTARATDDLPATLEIYVSRIPYEAEPYNWPVHIAGHPPGALTFFVVLVRLGLGSGFAAGMVVTAFAASTAVAVMSTLRTLGAEGAARRAAPFLVFGPAAIWQCVSADGMFAAVAAWGMAALAVAARGRVVGLSDRHSARSDPRPFSSIAWSIAAGLLLGYCAMLSYGLPLLGLLAVAILVVAKSWRPLIPAVLAALTVVLAYAAYGFYWWEAFPVLRERYWAGVASARPASYWIWANLACLFFSAGPFAGAALGHAATRVRRTVENAEERVVLWLAGAGAAMVLAANASQMSKAEVERIWLPFVPWILVACALLPERWRRTGLVLQVAVALVVQHVLHTTW